MPQSLTALVSARKLEPEDPKLLVLESLTIDIIAHRKDRKTT